MVEAIATAYSSSAWTDLFVASAGASAALTGLLFVAVSINLERILALRGLPERALETLMLLLGAVVISLIGLIPGQSTTALGIELLAASLLAGGFVARLVSRSMPPETLRKWAISRVAMALPGTALFVIGGASVLAQAGGGLYWIVAEIVGATIGASANAWVLLVEILR